MDAKDQIYIAPKRGRLPRRYEVIDERTWQTKLRWLALFCALGAAFWGTVWWWVAR